MNTVIAEHSARAPQWVRNYVWLIKRELWEHRGRFLITPLVISGVILIGVFYGLTQVNEIALRSGFHIDGLSVHMSTSAMTGADFAVYLAFSTPFLLAMSVIIPYYALDALYAERRDRSVLFWKSLPVSDLETVVAKLAVAAIVAPVITAVISIVTQLLVSFALSVALAAHGHAFGALWTEVPVLENVLVVCYALLVTALWYLPIWAWCLLASAWAQRAVLLWAIVPIGALWFLEYQTLGTHYIGQLLRTRTVGMIPLATSMSRELFEKGEGQALRSAHLSDVITPGVFFSSGQLWLGLLVAAGLVTATVWVRRYREAA